MYSTSRGSPSGADQLQRSFLLAFLEKRLQRSEITGLKLGLREIVQTAADDFFARQTQQLAGADAGLAVAAIVIGEQNGRGGMEDDRPEQQLQFLRTVFRKPAVALRLRGRGGQNHFSFAPSIQEAGGLERHMLQTVGNRKWRLTYSTT